MDGRQQTLRDKEEAIKILRRIDYCRELFTVGVFSAFLLTKIYRGTGLFVINGLLLVLTLIYALAISVRYFVGFRRNWGAYAKAAYRGINIGYSLVAVGITVYSIITAVTVPSATEIILAALSVLVLLVKVTVMIAAAAVQSKFSKKKSSANGQAEAEQTVEEPASLAQEGQPEQLSMFDGLPPAEPAPLAEQAERTEEPSSPEEKKKSGFFGWLFGKIPNDNEKK